MATKMVEVSGIGQVKVVKRKGQKSLKLRVNGSSVTLSMPPYTPYAVGLKFLDSRKDWLKEHLKEEVEYEHGMHIGKNHSLWLEPDTNRTRVTKTAVITNGDRDATTKAIHRALKKQSQNLITQRLVIISNDTGLKFESVNYKRMTGRWGSCSHKKELVFNIMLIQLPWPIIDYVIIHELCHTKFLDHSKKFWSEVEKHSPNYKEIRKKLRKLDPVIYNTAYEVQTDA